MYHLLRSLLPSDFYCQGMLILIETAKQFQDIFNPCHAEYFYVLHSSLIFIILACSILVVCLFDLILYIPSTIFQL